MRRKLITTLALPIILAPVLFAANEGPLTVSLEAVPATTLPSIPVTLRFTVTNVGATPAAMPAQTILIATNDAGETFPVRWQGRLVAPVSIWHDAPVPARSSVVVEVRTEGNLMEPDWFGDARLHRPGRYQLQMVLGTFAGDEYRIPEQGIRSTVASIQVSEPTGVDRDIWRQMLALGNGRWKAGYLFSPEGIALATRVLTETPYAQYAGWFAATGVGEKFSQRADALRNWLNQASSDQYTQWRELQLATFDTAAVEAWSQIKPEEVQRHLRNAQALLAKLTASTNKDIAARARDGLGRVEDLKDAVK